MPPQVFDTAIAVLALSALNVEPRIARSTYRPEELLEAIAKGKAFIESQQRPDGSWPETTRWEAAWSALGLTTSVPSTEEAANTVYRLPIY